MFRMSLPLRCGTVAAGNVWKGCSDSCNSSSLIPLQVLGVMVCIQRLALLRDVQGWMMIGVSRQMVLESSLVYGKIVLLQHAPPMCESTSCVAVVVIQRQQQAGEFKMNVRLILGA